MATDTWIGGSAGNWSTGSNWSSGAPPNSGDTVVINGTVSISNVNSLNSETLTFSTTQAGSSVVLGNINPSGSTITISGGLTAIFENGSNIINDSTIIATSGSSIDLGGPGGAGGAPNIAGNSVIEASAGATINVNAQIPSAPNGLSLLVNGGTLVDNVSSGGNVSLFQQPLNGSKPINLDNNPNSSVVYSGSGFNSNTVTQYEAMSTGYTSGSQFGSSHCFLAGTMIETAVGPVAVEHLRPGDQVVTLLHGNRVLQEIVWTGLQHIRIPPQSASFDLYPVRIRKDAFAPGIPCKDLRVTAEHCVFAEGRLIPVRMLVNGRGIAYDFDRISFDVYHIETAAHAIVIADGLAMETYLDVGDRRNFIPTGTVVQLAPKGMELAATPAKNYEMHAAAPLGTERAIVEPLYHSLESRAIALGMGSNQIALPRSEDPDLRLLTEDGTILRPIYTRGRQIIFALSGPCAAVTILSRTARPCDVIGPFLDDRRSLGVLVGQVSITRGVDRRSITSHLDPAAPGWAGVENEPCRWTQGGARLLLEHMAPGPATLEIEILAGGPYAVDPEHPALGRAQFR